MAQEIPDGSAVWIKDPDKNSTSVFLKSTVKQFLPGRGYTVTMPDGKDKTLRPVDVAMANPDGMMQPDNCYLIHISESTILDNMGLRFKKKKAIYTYTGSILLAVNPFEMLPIYGNDLMQPYVGRPLGIVEPHTYAMAEEAYKTLLKTKGSQSLVVSGESGSGKTETNKHLMRYLAFRSKKGGDQLNDLATVILQSNPVLEAFGNAKTSRNNNSSRFGKFVKIAMSEKGEVLGAATKQYLLEKSRVPFQGKGERNYHVFYNVIAGHKGDAAMGLGGGPESFWYLQQSGQFTVPGVKDIDAWKELAQAMSDIGMDAAKQDAVASVIAGLLHLGNTKFEGEDAAAPTSGSGACLEKFRGLFGSAEVEKSLCVRSLTTRGETTMVPLSSEKAVLARDALAKAVYTKLFDFIVDQVNVSIRGEATESSKFIGLLDVYGFESFAINTFEQLCINFANEKLQQFFLKFIFKAEEDLYKEECVSWTRIEYQDNQGCIDLIEKSPTGIMRILDETCKKPNSGDKNFCESVDQTHRRNDFFMEPRAAGHKQYHNSEAFVVRHFAGDVCYFGEGFCEKNNDTLHSDFADALAKSTNAVLPALFPVEGAGGAGRGPKKGGSFNSVSRRFINDLNQLMDDLNATKAHFIRCIKPNTELAAGGFTPSLVLNQLRCSGTVDAVQLMAGAYPTRIPYESIYGRYASQMPDFVQRLDPPMFCEALALALDIPSASFQLGRSKIFFKAGKGQVLEELAERDLSEVIPMLVEKIKQWEKRKAAQVKLQNACKTWLYKTIYRRKLKGVRTIQHVKRSKQIYFEYKKRHIQWLEKRKREEAERKKKEAEEKAKKEAEERAKQEAERKKQEEERKAAEEAAANSKNAEEKAKLEAIAATAKKAEEAAQAAAKAAEDAQAASVAEAEKAEAEANQEALTDEQIEAQIALEEAVEKERLEKETGAKGGGAAPPPPANDTVFTVELVRGNEGLGLDVDHYRKGATIGYVQPDGVAGKDGRIKVGDMIAAVNGKNCASYDDVINCIRAAGKTVELTLARKHVSLLLTSKLHMQVGARAEWEEFEFALYSNRELNFEKTQPPAYNGGIDVRLALEVRMIDAPNGGGFLEIETASKTYSLRCADSSVLHAWRRELYELLPYLRATEVKCGWLYKRGEGTSAGFKKRYCVLFSSYRLLYFESEACTKRKGAVDLSVAESVDSVSTSKGHGFEISTPGRTWVFAAEAHDEMLTWMGTLSTMLGDIKERKKRQQMQEGVTVLKEGWADLKDETQDGEGAWEGHWFSLNSAGELKIYPDAESTEEQLSMVIDLKEIERVERSKGVDFYDFCIDLCGAEKTTRMRPIDRGDMQAWLGVLQTQMSAFTQRTNNGSVITTLHQGWLEKKGEGGVMKGDSWKKRFFVLSARQEQAGDDLELQHFLHYFKSEDQASDVSEGGVIDLGDVDEVRRGDNKTIEIVTENRVWQLKAGSQNDQETWMRQLNGVCSSEEQGEKARISMSAPPVEAAADVTSIATAELKMQVPGTDGQATWKTAQFDLQTDGMLRWKSDEPWPWDAGAIDIKKALGVWLLGPPGWRRLDVILPEHRWTLAAENDEILQKWVKLLEDVAPEKPVSEIRNGWMEKKGAVGGGWKLRFFVLLSTHELLYFESDRSPKCKGVIDLKEALSCAQSASPDYNYEYSFEVVAPKRTWILCPDDQSQMQEWMSDIKPLIGGGGGGGDGGGGDGRKRRKSITEKGSRQYEADEDGNIGGGADGTATLKAGWLEKRGEINTSWKNRYFVLSSENPVKDISKMLRYFKDEDSARSAKNGGSAIEVDYSCKVSRGSSIDPDHPHYFEVATKTRTYMLCAPTADDLNEWIAALTGSAADAATPKGEGGEGGATKERRESEDSMASFVSSGPLVEVHSGWMQKKGQGVLLGSKMQKRYFVLYDNRELHYFEGTSMENITRKGRIRLATATDLTRLKPNDKKDFTFIIKVPGRDWILNPGTQGSFEEWDSKLRPMLG